MGWQSTQGSAKTDEREMAQRMVTGPQRALDIAALKERIATYDQWLEDLAESYRQAEHSTASGEAKAATLAILNGQIQKLKNARSTTLLELAKKQGDIL
jgi:hypothetical protein